MNIIEQLNTELELACGKQAFLEYKKWRRPKTKKSTPKNYPMVLQQLSTAAQVYDKSIKYIMDNNSSQELTNNSKNSIVSLLDEFDTSLDSVAKNTAHLKTTEVSIILDKVKTIKQNNKDIKHKLKTNKVFKVDVDKFLNTMHELLTAKLPKGAITAFALSNPLTAVIYNNWDIVKGAYNAITKS